MSMKHVNLIEELYSRIIIQESKDIGIMALSDNQFRICANRAIRAAVQLEKEYKRMEEENETN